MSFARLLDLVLWGNTPMPIKSSLSSFLLHSPPTQFHSLDPQNWVPYNIYKLPLVYAGWIMQLFWDIVHFFSSSPNSSLAIFCCDLILILLLGLGAGSRCGARSHAIWEYSLEAVALCSRKGKLGPFDFCYNRDMWSLPVEAEGSRGSEASIFPTHMSPSHSQSHCYPSKALTWCSWNFNVLL